MSQFRRQPRRVQRESTIDIAAIPPTAGRELSLLAVGGILTLLCAALVSASIDASEIGTPDPDVVPAGDWDQWRGPGRDGTIDAAPWPETFAGLEPLWRVPLGKGYAGPIVTADRVFVVETADQDTEQVRALDRATGEELWATSWKGEGKVPFFAARNGDWVRSTPAWDGQVLYVGGMEERLHKIEGATGEILWTVDFPSRFGTRVPDFGFASSPLVDGSDLYVQGADSIVKLDTATGETVWRAMASEGDIMSSGAFSSPFLTELAGRSQLLVQSRHVLAGLDPVSGEKLWSTPVPSFRGMNILTPTVWRDSILTSTHRNQTFLYSVAATDEGFEVTQPWIHKAQGYMSTPVVIADHAYLHLGNGRVTCIDLVTGEATWTSKPFGSYWSLVANGDRILALDEGGELVLLAADPTELRVLDRREISDQSTWGHLAVHGSHLFVRELEAIAAYRWTGSDSSTERPPATTARLDAIRAVAAATSR